MIPANRARAFVPMLALVLAYGCMPSPTLTPLPASSGNPADSGRAGGPHVTVKPYAEVIPKNAQTRSGLFVTHRVGDTLYFEIPPRELNRDMLLVGRFARTAAVDASNPFGAYGGDEFGERTLRWERSGSRIILRSPSFAIMADSSLPIYRAVQTGSYAPIIAIFDIAAFGPDSSAVIDVTRLYTTDVPEFAAIHGQVDDKRSYIESAVAFPDNVEIEATQTGIPQPTGAISSARDRESAISVLAHWSMVRLPAFPMTPRLADDRVGFLSVTRTDYGTQQYRSVERVYINRWRLEKKDPSAAVSDPVKPIAYFIDPATPDQWKPWIRKAVLDWQPAFERAGFSNAIISMDPPSNDPDWSPDDVRHTVIRWLPSTVENAVGPHVADPRTGEVLNGSIRIFHNVLNLNRDWYFTQVAPLDPRAQHWPMPDSLMGRMVEFVVAHEIGHTLGLTHNFKASAMYPADSVRSRTWVHSMGFTPSVMDYARYDYVAQPSDSIGVNDLVARVGPYDTFAIMWGYKPVPGAHNPEQERPALDSIARMQDSVPWYRFGHLAETRADNPDPTDEAEAVGDADAVKSTGYGVKNIERIMPMLLRVTQKPGEDNSDLAEIYERLVGQWADEMTHVANIVGGEIADTKYGAQPGSVFTPVSRERQVEAIRFLTENVFHTPSFFLDRSVTSRIEPSGSLSRINDAQGRILHALLDDYKLQRMIEISSHGGVSYTVPEMLADVRRGIWAELGDRSVVIDVYRRNLQRAYLDQMDQKINGSRGEGFTIVMTPNPAPGPRRRLPLNSPAAMADARSSMRAEIVALRAEVIAAMPRAADAATRAHLADAKVMMDRILDPNR
ncbi:MAG: zinc-dependent metalloprotease [Gemmatimonadota bacterium]|nr:zinc-dependent metalloprotease [Gemmatimonadota bacterium]